MSITIKTISILTKCKVCCSNSATKRNNKSINKKQQKMEKRISYSQFQQVKAAAKMVDPLYRKMNPLKAKIEELVSELRGYQTQIDALEAGIVSVLGFHVSDLVKKVIEPTGKNDPKTGKPLMSTKYLPTDIVTYDEHKKQYVISIPDETSVNDSNTLVDNNVNSEENISSPSENFPFNN